MHEVGDLLQVTKEIKSIDEESRDVLIEICGHIKDIRRVQLAFEQKEFEGDAEARWCAEGVAQPVPAGDVFDQHSGLGLEAERHLGGVRRVEDHRAPLLFVNVEFPAGSWSRWVEAHDAGTAFEIQMHDSKGDLRRRSDLHSPEELFDEIYRGQAAAKARS